MFTEFLTRLKTGSTKPLNATDAQLALGALLVRIAKSDRDYAVEEIRQIDKILGARFDLNPIEAAKLRAAAEQVEASAPETSDFADAVKAAVDYAERSAIVGELWNVVQADGIERDEETSLFARAAVTFGVDPADLRAS